MPELHTWLNKAKRTDNRFSEIALKKDACLKSLLAKSNIDDFDRLTKSIYDESTQESPKQQTLNSLKKELNSISGPHELAYEKLLSENGIARSTAHGAFSKRRKFAISWPLKRGLSRTGNRLNLDQIMRFSAFENIC